MNSKAFKTPYKSVDDYFAAIADKFEKPPSKSQKPPSKSQKPRKVKETLPPPDRKIAPSQIQASCLPSIKNELFKAEAKTRPLLVFSNLPKVKVAAVNSTLCHFPSKVCRIL